MAFHCFHCFHGFFNELDFKELEIHRYSLLDTINEYQWISIGNLVTNGGPKNNKNCEKLKNRLFHKKRFFDNFKLNVGGLGVSGGMAWTVRTDSLEVWRDLVLHGMGEVDFHVLPK